MSTEVLNLNLLSEDAFVAKMDQLIAATSNSGSKHIIIGTATQEGKWLGTDAGITSYTDGMVIQYKVPVAGTDSTTIKINNLAEKNCYSYNNTPIETQYAVGSWINLIYCADLNGGSFVISDFSDKYTHPTGNGYNHIPAGGSEGQILKWNGNGTAAWRDNVAAGALSLNLANTKYYPPNGFVNMEYKNGYYLVASGLYLYWTEDFITWNRSQISTDTNYEANKVYLEGDMIICCKVDINRPKHFKSSYISYVLGDVSDDMTWYYGSGHIGYINNVYIQNPTTYRAKIKQSSNGIDWNQINTYSIFSNYNGTDDTKACVDDLIRKINNVWYGFRYETNSSNYYYYLYSIADLLNPLKTDKFYTYASNSSNYYYYSSPQDLLYYNNEIYFVYMYGRSNSSYSYKWNYYNAYTSYEDNQPINDGDYSQSYLSSKNAIDIIQFNNKYICRFFNEFYKCDTMDKMNTASLINLYMPSGMLLSDKSLGKNINFCLLNNKLFLIGDSRFPIMEYIEDNDIKMVLPKMISNTANQSLSLNLNGDLLIYNTLKNSTNNNYIKMKSSNGINWTDEISNDIYPINIGSERFNFDISKYYYSSKYYSRSYIIKDFIIDENNYKLIIQYRKEGNTDQLELYKNGTRICSYKIQLEAELYNDSNIAKQYMFINIANKNNLIYISIKTKKPFNTYNTTFNSNINSNTTYQYDTFTDISYNTYGQYLIEINSAIDSVNLINAPFNPYYYDNSARDTLINEEKIFTYQFINTMISWKNKLITIDRSGNVYSDNLLIAYVPIHDAFGMVPVLNNNYMIVYNDKQIFASSDDGYTWNNLKINLPENIAWVYSDHTHLYIIGENNTRYIYE